jgi:hypothetical protein
MRVKMSLPMCPRAAVVLATGMVVRRTMVRAATGGLWVAAVTPGRGHARAKARANSNVPWCI